MKVAAIFLSLVANAAAAVLTSEPRVVRNTELPHPMGELGWTGTLEEGGPEVNYWGANLEDIDLKVKRDFPGLSIFKKAADGEASSPPDYAAALARRNLQKRSTCTERFGSTEYYDIYPVMDAIRTWTGWCSARARQCISLQCHDAGGISLCNDNYFDINVSCNHVADMAQNICNNCVYPKWCDVTKYGLHFTDVCGAYTAGQEFDSGSYNVIIGHCNFISPSGQPV